jgi:tetratricopeptide (TPR) repeat protein
MSETEKKKILLIGWDGADWKVINPLMEAGLMPNLHRLVNGGTIGNLATLDPPYSPMLWTSIATGKRPYKHGVFGFYEPDPDGENVRPVLSISRNCKAIWNILTQKNYKTHVAGWWPSHPAEPINGTAISNFYQRPGKDGIDNWPLPPHSVSPESSAEHFSHLRIHPSELTGGHILPFIPEISKLSRPQLKKIDPLIQILAENATLQSAFTNILRTQEWDFASVYFDGIDKICHEFMKYHPPHRSHIPKDEFDLYKDVVTGIYRFSDMMLGRQMELAGEEATIMLVSDHGFQPDHLRPRNIPHEPAGIAYEHSPYGIFCMKGPGIKKDSLVHGASILDITPTILHLLDLPLGDDMDGVPLLSVFEKPNIPKTIPSWEEVLGESGMPSKKLVENRAFIDDMMTQLIELGYIDQPDENKEKAYQDASRFCEINLARAYLDGGEVEEATRLFEKRYVENPNAPWIAYRLAICYQMLGHHANCRKLIEKLKAGHFYESSFIGIMEASLLMGEGEYQAAVDLLQKIEKDIPENTQNIYLKIGRCYSMLGKPEEAAIAMTKELEIDFENPQAHQFLGAIHYNQGRYEAATKSLLNAISLEYNLAEAHYLLGRTLLAQGDYEAASDAFEVCLSMAPFNNHARQLLAYTYRTHLDDPAKASKVMQDFNKNLLGTVVIVSGLPRSGTSMMMQMLEKGGLPIFTDGERTADDNNPKGYYEHQIVKKITHNTEWLKSARDKVVKIVAPIVCHLPYNYRYKIIFMERNPYEIYASQQQMLNRMGSKNRMDTLSLEMVKTMEKSVIDTKQWIEKHPGAEVIYLNYKEVLSSPLEQAIKINEFINHPLNPVAMVGAVDPSLHREKSALK